MENSINNANTNQNQLSPDDISDQNAISHSSENSEQTQVQSIENNDVNTNSNQGDSISNSVASQSTPSVTVEPSTSLENTDQSTGVQTPNKLESKLNETHFYCTNIQ